MALAGVLMLLAPRFPADAWTAGAACAVALLNAAALFLLGDADPLAHRLRRIALIANTLLALAALLFAAGSLAHGAAPTTLALAAFLAVPPLVSWAALAGWRR